ncbi:putative protein OS=Streptomyces alboniger OX=132473 GN=CP975_04685 PE=4 SV=1 [Streptomyces alboniger]
MRSSPGCSGTGGLPRAAVRRWRKPDQGGRDRGGPRGGRGGRRDRFPGAGRDKDDEADGGKDAKPSTSKSTEPSASTSPSEDDPRGGDAEKATVAGWKIVVNPKWGTAFDVPADWEVQSPTSAIAFEEENSDDLKPIITMGAPAILKSKWCESDDDKDGRTDTMSLAAAGTKGADGAKDTDEVALNNACLVGLRRVHPAGQEEHHRREEGHALHDRVRHQGQLLLGVVDRPHPAKGKCVTDGKAISFGFKNSAGDFVSWNFYGAKGVKEEVPKETIMKILSTVRLQGDPTG